MMNDRLGRYDGGRSYCMHSVPPARKMCAVREFRDLSPLA